MRSNSSRCRFNLILIATLCVVGFLPEALGQGASDREDQLMAQAAAARMQNDVPRAIELYSQVVERNPKSPDAWWFLGSLQYGTGAYIAARDALSHYVDLIPTAGPAFALRGLCEFETGEYSKALVDIQQGTKLGAANQPRNEQILRYHEALLLTRLGNFSAALKTYAYFAKDSISNPELMTAIGLAGLRMPMLPKELVQDQQTKDPQGKDPQSKDPQVKDQQELVSAAGNAAYRYMAGDEASAKQSFQELFQRFPKATNTHFLYGYLLFSTNPDAAFDEFQKELEISPANADADVMAAWALLLRNEPADALPYAQKAADAEPSHPSAQLVLGKSLMESGDLENGMQHLEKAAQLEPDNLEAHLALAKAYSKSGRKEEARRERQLSLRLTSGNGTPTEHP